MKIINKKTNQVTFQATMSESLANAIRRSLTEIPVLAIDEIEIMKNGSPLYDETVAHRMGLIPLSMEKAVDAKKLPKLKLSSKKEGLVYSGELKGSVAPVFDTIPITTLIKGQELEINATTILGKGNEHAKFNPGLLYYRNLVDIKVGKDCPKDVVDACPHNIFVNEGNKIVVENASLCDMCESCLDVTNKLGKTEAITLSPSSELTITLESFGQMDVKEIFKKAVDELKKELSDVSKKISK